MASQKQQADDLRQQGNDCVKASNYMEAVVHYTHALRLDKQSPLVYSNRSLAFLKLQQYYLALEDAKHVVRLSPTWPKGFYRKGNVEFQVGHYTAALISYGQALLLDPSNAEVRAAVEKTNKEITKMRKAAARQPWMFCGGGAALGLFIVLGDQYLAKQPSIHLLILQIVLVVIFTGLGYVTLRVYSSWIERSSDVERIFVVQEKSTSISIPRTIVSSRYMQQSQKSSLLEPPIDLLDEMGKGKTNDVNQEPKEDVKPSEAKPHRKGGTSAARQRYKKGKS